MVYDTRNYRVFGLCPLSRILKNTREHNVSETGSVSVLRLGLLHKISTSYFQACTCFITIFIVHFSCYLPLTEPGLRCLYSCSYTDTGRPVTEVSTFYRTQQRCLPPPHLRTETSSSRNIVFTSVFLEYRTMDKVR
jgi:hypothetical protein